MRLIQSVHAFLWGIPGIVVILLFGSYLTVSTGFVQVRLFSHGLRSLCQDRAFSRNGEFSLRRSFFTALGSTVGTGNLIGVAGAICLGGPGSIFWMWVCAFFAMATKYAEALLAVRYRVTDACGIRGGVMYTVSRGLKKAFSPLASCYCVLCVFAAFGIGSAVQSDAICASVRDLSDCLHFPFGRLSAVLVGALTAFLYFATVRCGTDKIGSCCEALVPIAGGTYILLCTVCLIIRRDCIIRSIQAIFSGAFHPGAVTGGVIGSFLRTLCVGCRRGVFSNEAGLGTATMAHAKGSANPVLQGTMGILEVFTDTILVCTLTALVLLSSGVPIGYGCDSGSELFLQAFSATLGRGCVVVLAPVIWVLSYATVIGWALYGSTCMDYLFGSLSVPVFYVMQAFGLLFGAVVHSQSVWIMAETANALLMIPNLISLFALRKEVCEVTKDFLSDDAGRQGRYLCKYPSMQTVVNRHP